ncbi:MAG: hypothetical protein JO257_12480 [Deltaproteobacteria bacterium]|nr:hypothetical protein [Deltaproteobacteria bacterium]
MDAFLAEHSGDDEDAPAKSARPMTSGDAESIDVDEIEEVEPDVSGPSKPAPAPVTPPAFRPPPVPPRPVVAIPPPRPGGIPSPPGGVPKMKPPAIPPMRTSQPIPQVSIPAPRVSVPPIAASVPPPAADARSKPPTGPMPTLEPRTKPPTAPPQPGEMSVPRTKPPTAPPRPRTPTGEPRFKTGEHAPVQAHADDDVLSHGTDLSQPVDGGVEVGTAEPNIVVDQPLEAALESPTVVDKAIGELGEAGGEKRAEAMSKELEAKVLTDPAAAAYIAYELGELYERRLADEARAVKAFGRALNLDPSLRPNLWAIRRVFYRRQLWPNLAKLVDAEVAYARDDAERADLLLEKARVVGHRLNEPGEARNALDEAVAIAPAHQGVLLELERVAAKAGDIGALLDVWERLADAVEHPSRKIAYWLEVGRGAASNGELPRAIEAFEKASQLAGTTPAAERVARERLRVIEEHGTPADIAAAIDALSSVLLAAFGPAGPAADAPATDRAVHLRHELVALRRRQAQLARSESPDKAWELLQQASAMAPGEAIVLADLTELAEELGRYADLAELVQSWQAVEGDPARAMVLSIRRADALLRGGARDQARALLASLEAAAPGFVVLTSAAERDALGRQDARALANTLLSAAHAAHLGTWLGPGQDPQPDPNAAAALYVQAAELLAYEVAAHDAPEAPELFNEARAALGKALEAVPDYPPAIEALVELDDAQGQVGEALARLRGAAERAGKADKRPLLERAVRLARGHGDLDAVLALEQELIALAPDDLPLRWRLESTLAQLGKDDERAALLVQIAADETDATRRGTALSSAARLRERAGQVEAATDLYRQVLVLWPEDTFARESLVDLLRAQEKWTELVAERRAEARALPDGPAARRALREAAWVLEVRLGDAAQAAQVYEEWSQRFPDDIAAIEGVARCRAAANDWAGEARARAQAAENSSPDARWLYARALERANQHDDAADQYRQLLQIDESQPSLPAIGATLSLGDLAAARGDTVMRVEATASLAGRTSDPALGSALAEDSGWMYALVLEDFDRAAASFEAAITLDPTRRGALLGAALVGARRGDQPAMAQAYEGLAAAVSAQMPEAAAALLLRGAAMAAASGDLELANQRVLAARTASPDDTSALLVVAETGQLPHVDPADAFAAVDPLLARAEVLEMRGALADDPAARASWELDRAEALELAGRLRESGAVVAAVIKTRPDDLRALSALRRMATRAGDKSTQASAAYALARVIGDPTAKLEMLREAAAIFDGPGLPRNTDYAVATYRRIVAAERGAFEHERLLELLRERRDTRGLVAAITDRLAWLEAEGGATETVVPLLLERATVLHGLGETENAMADLDALLDRSTKNVEALRFRADLAFNAGDVDTAVSLWRRYLAAETRAPRRAEVELQLSQVLAENTGDLAGAIEQLERVVEGASDDVQLRERLLGLCLRANDYDRAVKELRALARMRATPQERAREELRLGLMLRDKLNDRNGARLALDRARTLDPVNLDVVRELADLLEPPARAQMLGATAVNLRDAIQQGPGRAQFYDRLAQVNSWQPDVDARWLALAAFEALGTPAPDQKQVLAAGRSQLKAPTRIKLDDASRRMLRGELGGPLLELWRAIAPGVQVATGVDPGKLGFGRGDRLAVKKLGDKFEPLVTALTAFGVEDVDVYISASRGGFARSLAAETPILCLGADVAAASTPQQRFLLGRAVATLAEGTSALDALREGELAWTIAAALRAFDQPVPAQLAEVVAGEDAPIAERAKVLKKELSRKARGVVQQLGRSAGESDVAQFEAAAIAVGQRAGLVWAGDLAVALSVLDVGKGGRSITDSAAALALVAWSVSDEHLKLRDKLGVAIKGAR